MSTQREVTAFYDDLRFPSGSSHEAYRRLVPSDLAGSIVGDFGCGQSLFADTFRRLGCNAVFLDIALNALRSVEGDKRINASLTDLPLRSGVMDAVFCIGVVHHIPDMEAAMAELLRVLRPGGRLYLGVYREKSLQAALRKTYDRAPGRLPKGLVSSLSGLLIWLKNRRNGLTYGGDEHRRRIRDLLLTPLVRYLPAGAYEDILERHDGIVIERKIISSMIVLVVGKRSAS